MSKARREAHGNPLLIRAVWLYRPNLSPVIPVILQWDGLRFRSSLDARAGSIQIAQSLEPYYRNLTILID